MRPEVKDRIFPDENKASFVREISVDRPEQTEALKFKLAEGKKIEKMPDGSFAIDDKQYYIKMLSGQLPEVREINGIKELILPIADNSIKYSIIQSLSSLPIYNVLRCWRVEVLR